MAHWGFFSPGGTWVHGTHAWEPFGLIQFCGIAFFVFLFSTLFWAKGFYRFLGRHRSVTITIGVLYLMAYLVYYTLNIVYFYTAFPHLTTHFTYNVFQLNYLNMQPHFPTGTNFGPPPVAKPQDIMPLHLSSMGQICAGTLLITRNKKLFNLTMPFLGVLPIIAIIAPAKVFYGPQNYFYYDYYFNHATMIVVYWWMYLYGISRYNVHMLRFNFIFAIGSVLTALGYDWVFNTNLMFVGKLGYPLNAITSTADLFGHPASAWQSFFCMLVIGSVSLFIGYMLVVLKKPFYKFNSLLNKFAIGERNTPTEIKSALSNLFIWNKQYLKNIKI